MDTFKTRLVSQSARLEIAVRPIIHGNTVRAEVKVTRAMPNGLAKAIVKAFGLHGKVRKLVQREVDKKLKGKQFDLPADVLEYDVQVKQARFVDLSGGRLGLKLTASGSVSETQLAKLINDKVSSAN